MAKKMFLLLGMILLSCVTAYASHSYYVADECCFHFLEQPLRKENVTKYRRTSPHCPKPGIIFTMRRNAEFCVHADATWVKNVVKYIEKK